MKNDDFCSVCKHKVFNMEEHLKTGEHQRKLKNGASRKGPKLPGFPKDGFQDLAPFSGRRCRRDR